MRVRVCAAALAAAAWTGATWVDAAWLGEARAQSRYAEPGQYGGGLIEYLVTGGAQDARGLAQAAGPVPRQPQAATVGYAYPPGSGDPLQSYSGAPRRHAALPPSGLYPQGNAYPPGGGYPQAGLYPQPEPQAEPHFAMREPPEERIGRGLDPRYARQEVAYDGPQRPGTIVVDTPNKYLYLVQPGGRALRYGIGVGRPGFTWAGLKTVSRKAEWPDWIPPAEMLARRPDLPRHMAGGPQNPLGARALYLGSSLYRIHGTNEPHTIGQSVSSGCIRMMNEDVTDLYDRVPVGTRVIVL
jgi:lipoprotein-anchoring transpeptidase ErfK/SrfK